MCVIPKTILQNEIERITMKKCDSAKKCAEGKSTTTVCKSTKKKMGGMLQAFWKHPVFYYVKNEVRRNRTSVSKEVYLLYV